MKPFQQLSTLLIALGFALPTIQAQEESPVIPVGSLSAFPTIVQTGTHPQLTWDITIPETVEEIIEITPPGTITPRRDLIMDVRILGAGVTYFQYNQLHFAPTETRISINGGNYDQIFYGTNHDVDPNEIVFSREMALAVNAGLKPVRE